jgi:hypothetical protein
MGGTHDCFAAMLAKQRADKGCTPFLLLVILVVVVVVLVLVVVHVVVVVHGVVRT